MLWEPIENRYRKENRIFHSSAFAIAAGVVGVAAAGASAAVSMSSSAAAARQASAAGQRLTKAQKKALQQYEAALANVKAPEWNLNADIKDAEKVTGYNQAQLEQLYPGARSQRELASVAVSDYLRGQVPADVQAQTMRAIAERGGAGFNIATAGMGQPGVPTAPQADFARQLGLTSLNLQQAGMGLSMDWQKLAGAFIESPLQVGQARLGFEKARADIEMQKAAALYGGQTEVAQGAYGTSMNTIGANLASRQAMAQGIQSIGSAASGLISGVGAAYNQYSAAQNASTTPMESGFFKGEIGASNAYNVAPSQLSYQKGGGYYYNPSGQYGREDIPRNIVYGR